MASGPGRCGTVRASGPGTEVQALIPTGQSPARTDRVPPQCGRGLRRPDRRRWRWPAASRAAALRLRHRRQRLGRLGGEHRLAVRRWCSRTPTTPAPTMSAAPPTARPATYAPRSPISTRPSSSTRPSTRPMPTARWSSAGRATTTAPSRTTTRRSRSTPNYAPAYVGRGNMYRQRKQTDLALADFNSAIQLDPTDPRAYHNRGLIEQAQGQHTPAIADFSKAISLAPSAVEPYNAPRPLLSGDQRLSAPPSTTSTRWSSATGIPTRAGPTRASRWRSSARRKQGLRRLRPRQHPQSALRAGTRGHAPHDPGPRRRGERRLQHRLRSFVSFGHASPGLIRRTSSCPRRAGHPRPAPSS